MKSKIFFLVVVAVFILSAANLNAQVKAGSFSVSPIAGYSKFAETSDFENASVYGVSLGYNFSEKFGIEGIYNTLDTEVKPEGVTETQGGGGPPGPPPASFRGVSGSLVAFQPPPPGGGGTVVVVAPGGTEVSGHQMRIEGLYYIYPGNKFAPYIAVGLGTLSYEYINNESVTKKFSQVNFPAGFGFKYFVTDKIAIRADVRSVVPMHHNNIVATIGATFQFGGK